MDSNDSVRFAKTMLGMADNFRDTITKEGMDMRFDLLKNFSIEQIEAAAKKIILSRKYLRMPTIADIVEAISGPPPTEEDRALVIANEIVAHLRRHGAGVYPRLDHDPVAKRLMESRWPYRRWAAEILDSELKWWVKEFCEAYGAYSAAGENVPQIGLATPEARQLLAGIGKEIQQPRLKAIAGGIGG